MKKKSGAGIKRWMPAALMCLLLTAAGSCNFERSAKGEVSANLLSDNQIAAVKHSDGDVGVVREILADLARREVDHNRDRTSVFVKSVIEHMGEAPASD
jgi:hypothetical protein